MNIHNVLRVLIRDTRYADCDGNAYDSIYFVKDFGKGEVYPKKTKESFDQAIELVKEYLKTYEEDIEFYKERGYTYQEAIKKAVPMYRIVNTQYISMEAAKKEIALMAKASALNVMLQKAEKELESFKEQNYPGTDFISEVQS